MKWLRGYYRLSLAGLVLGFGGSLIIITSWIPIKIKGVRLPIWWVCLVARALLFLLNVKADCAQADKLRQHEGFVFPNHVTYVDILVLLSVAPVRFLAKYEVRAWPIVGQLAQAIGCVFVKREDKASRMEARTMLANVDRFPSVVLFPEGKRGPGHELLPFRYGAFEIVVQGSVPFLPCVIVYDQLEIAIWRRGQPVLKAIWRLASHRQPVHARLIVLDSVQPTPDEDPVQLSLDTHRSMMAALTESRSGVA
jgi:1-acyl-sn-glycerol-3-phosphate acyltransferase